MCPFKDGLREFISAILFTVREHQYSNETHSQEQSPGTTKSFAVSNKVGETGTGEAETFFGFRFLVPLQRNLFLIFF